MEKIRWPLGKTLKEDSKGHMDIPYLWELCGKYLHPRPFEEKKRQRKGSQMERPKL
jgi:hypothetical protein